jgi:hypothetical protein
LTLPALHNHAAAGQSSDVASIISAGPTDMELQQTMMLISNMISHGIPLQRNLDSR